MTPLSVRAFLGRLADLAMAAIGEVEVETHSNKVSTMHMYVCTYVLWCRLTHLLTGDHKKQTKPILHLQKERDLRLKQHHCMEKNERVTLSKWL